MRALAALAASAALVGACGGGPTRGHPLDVGWADEDGAELAAFERVFDAPERVAARAAVEADEPSVFVGVSLVQAADAEVTTLLGRAEPGARRWAYEHPLESPPWLAGSVVVGLGGGELFALDAASGEPLWSRRVGGRLRGAADDGATTLVSLGSLSGARSIVLALDRSGSVRRQLDVRAQVGVPAVAGELAFLPWQGEGVVVLDLLEGRETARLVRREPVTEARAVDGVLYFGDGTRALRFDADAVAARRGGGREVSVRLPRLPEAPTWLGLRDEDALGRHPRRWVERATRARVHAHPAALDGAAAATAGGALLAYYRIAAAFPALGGAARWVVTSRHDLLGGAASANGFALCDAGGEARWLSARDGRVVAARSLGAPLVACAVSARPPEAREAGTSEDPASAPEPRTTQLVRALSLSDRRVLPLQLELCGALADEPGEDATEALLAVAAQETVPDAVRATASERLERRPAGGAMLRALLRRAERPSELGALGWLTGAVPWDPPLRVLARALAAAGEVAAVEPLARLLGDASLSDQELAAVSGALEVLGGTAARAALVGFVATHGCVTGRPALAAAVAAAARSLERLGATGPLARGRALGCF
ncbi:MAG: PQQ-binding-like beta-propeller repeat protein [Polyangiaceae bacterium]|nr:PQQ-binding-like beta-propeller repeat protein [Polyangiaceae bacterium]